TNAFGGVPYSSVTLYVPSGSASAYRALAPWSNFSSNIVETDLTSIQTPTISSSETIVGYYNLQGQRIAEPQKGIVIVRYSDGTSRKMYVR
ncbi:MAG: leucine-rich repeat domain-containing protein, partial [Bacteroidaceae bacterium]|nr:leucine-rich repeat domain-containing protein [Bacteroidaceae bacterium]